MAHTQDTQSATNGNLATPAADVVRSVLLICRAGPDVGKRVALSDREVLLGRSSDCQALSDAPDVASKHAAVWLRDGCPAFRAVAPASVFVDGQPVEVGILAPGQQIRVGRSVWQVAADRPSDLGSLVSQVGRGITRVVEVAPVQGFSLQAMFSDAFKRRSDEETDRYFSVGSPATTPPFALVDTSWPRPWAFVQVFLLAAVAYLGFRWGVQEFQNLNLIPGLIIVGSFAIPLSLLILFFEANVPRNVSLYQVLRLVVLGGVLSLILSLFLFDWTDNLQSQLGAPAAGLIEEPGKTLALLLVVQKLRYRWILNGLLFGAAIGTGFAAFESAGYAFNLLLAGGFDAMNDTITLRGGLSILGGHVVWTALVGAALWRVRGDQPFQLSMVRDPRFLRAFALAVVLHMLWNTSYHPPFYLKYVALGFVGWVAVLGYVQLGLAQIREAQGAQSDHPVGRLAG